MDYAKLYLTFHGVGTPKRDISDSEKKYWVDEDHFRELLSILERYRQKVEITFDDGNISDIAIAFPDLLSRNLRARFFVITGRLNKQGYLSKADIQELAAAGMIVGSHGRQHRPLKAMQLFGLLRELLVSRKLLQEICNASIDEFAVPFGIYGKREIRSAFACGYSKVFTSDGFWSLSKEVVIGRLSVTRAVSPEQLERLVQRGPNLLSRARKKVLKTVKCHLC
ncbi:MAG: polysaccharide deacetylase family protein [Acidobacteriota bacterium]